MHLAPLGMHEQLGRERQETLVAEARAVRRRVADRHRPYRVAVVLAILALAMAILAAAAGAAPSRVDHAAPTAAVRAMSLQSRHTTALPRRTVFMANGELTRARPAA